MPRVLAIALRHTLCGHAAGNYRIPIAMSARLLAAAAQREPPWINDNVVVHIHTSIDDPPSDSTTAQRRASPASPLPALLITMSSQAASSSLRQHGP